MEKRPNPSTQKGNNPTPPKTVKRRRQFDPDYKGIYDEQTIGKSMTQPDQNLSVRTLLDRHSRGIPIPTSMREGQYYGVEIPSIYDLNDLNDNREKLENVKRDIEDELSALKKLENEKTSQEPPKEPTEPKPMEPPKEK